MPVKHIDSTTQQRLREIFNYNSSTGDFTRIKAKCGIKIGDIAGATNSKGYRTIMVDGVMYLAHRLAWLYVYGEWPKGQIDHINHIRSDNRIGNLRDVTQSQNQWNQKRCKGYSWSASKRKFVAYIGVNGKKQHLGYYDTENEAKEAYLSTKKKLHAMAEVA